MEAPALLVSLEAKSDLSNKDKKATFSFVTAPWVHVSFLRPALEQAGFEPRKQACEAVG